MSSGHAEDQDNLNDSDAAAELTSISDDDVVVHLGTRAERREGLEPGAEFELFGIRGRTQPRPGELLSTFATVNDVHFGETVAGKIDGVDEWETYSVPVGADPYPEVMNAGAAAEIAAIDPALVVAKGDLTSTGAAEEYDRFLDVYGSAFGDRLLHVRGNHESFHRLDRAAWPMQERELDGVVVALLDTSRDGMVNGHLTADQLDWLDELGARADRPVMVFGHHPVWNPAEEPRHDETFGILPDATEALAATFARRPRLRAYVAGHTHRNRVVRLPGTDRPFVEVACVKDFPGSWAEYRVFDGGIMQIHRRISTPDALRWSERTRHMYNGLYETYAMGPLAERCFVISADG